MYDSKYFTCKADGSVTLRPEFVQKLKCASGEHEPNGHPLYPSHPNIAECKHCRCLYNTN